MFRVCTACMQPVPERLFDGMRSVGGIIFISWGAFIRLSGVMGSEKTIYAVCVIRA